MNQTTFVVIFAWASVIVFFIRSVWREVGGKMIDYGMFCMPGLPLLCLVWANIRRYGDDPAGYVFGAFITGLVLCLGFLVYDFFVRWKSK